MTPRMFPILYSGYTLKDDASSLCRAGHAVLLIGFPWDLLAAHEAQAVKNHSQSLQCLADRGGLDPGELLAVLEDRAPRWHDLQPAEAQARLLQILERAGLLAGILTPATR